MPALVEHFVKFCEAINITMEAAKLFRVTHISVGIGIEVSILTLLVSEILRTERAMSIVGIKAFQLPKESDQLTDNLREVTS